MFICEKCQKHFREMYNDYPIDEFRNNFEAMNFYHNRVNKRLNKDLISLDDAKKIYSNGIDDDDLWTTLFTLCAKAKSEYFHNYSQIFKHLPYLLPKDTQVVFKSVLKTVPVDSFTNDNSALFVWTYVFYETVNKKINRETKDLYYFIHTFLEEEECSSCRL